MHLWKGSTIRVGWLWCICPMIGREWEGPRFNENEHTYCDLRRGKRKQNWRNKSESNTIMEGMGSSSCLTIGPIFKYNFMAFFYVWSYISHLNCDQFRLWGDHGIKKGSTKLKNLLGSPTQYTSNLPILYFRPTSLYMLLVRPKNNLPKQFIFFISFFLSFSFF